MAANLDRMLALTEQLLNEGGIRRSGLTELDKLLVGCILGRKSYRQASLDHQYTESSFQNAASRLFKDLSLVFDKKLNRRNFAEVMGEEYERRRAKELEGEIVFDRLQAQLWLREKQARILSVSYQANQVLDIADYLVNFSPHFAVTLCLQVSVQSSAVELLWSLCQSLLVTIPPTKKDVAGLLQLIGGGAAAAENAVGVAVRYGRSRPAGSAESVGF